MVNGFLKKVAILAFFWLLFHSVHADLCTCESYVKDEGGFTDNNKVTSLTYSLQDYSCETDKESDHCRKFCYESYHKLTAGGDLDAIPKNSFKTVGQIICQLVKRDVKRKLVKLYAKSCGGDLEFSGLSTKKPLCCRKKKYYKCPA